MSTEAAVTQLVRHLELAGERLSAQRPRVLIVRSRPMIAYSDEELQGCTRALLVVAVGEGADDTMGALQNLAQLVCEMLDSNAGHDKAIGEQIREFVEAAMPKKDEDEPCEMG